MIPIIKRRERITETTYDYNYHWKGDPDHHCGFGFPCDKDGNIFFDQMCDEAKANYAKCKDGTYDVEDMGVRPYTHSWVEPAEAKCLCGHIIYLESFTNTCEKCGRDYNMSGQELAPRRFWGEETGETADEILNIGHTVS